ncbi:MAG: plasmid recombination protein [Acetatifactor sp.]|nr:plasmid recombination protein [Acetatifactor sp.]
MNTQKYKVGNLGLLSEADRSMYDKKDTISKSIIDPARTHLNYNLCPHPQYTTAQVKEINKKIRGKEIAKNAVAWGSTIVTVPQDYGGNLQDFFATAYKGLKKMYKLKDEDIISAYVHMDETTPHMHFYFIPVKHEQDKDRIKWDGVMPRKMYQQQHRILQKYMTEVLQTPVNLLNGATKGIDVRTMTADEKRLSMRVEALKKSVSGLRKQEISAKKSLDAIEAEIAEKQEIADKVFKPYQDAVERLLGQFAKLTPKQQAKERSVLDMVEKSGRIFGNRNPKEIAKATTALEKESERIESEYLSIEDDDDFER